MRVEEDFISADSHTAWDLVYPTDDDSFGPWLCATMGTNNVTDAALVMFSMPTADRMPEDLRDRTRRAVMAETTNISKGRLNWSPKENWVDQVGGLPKYIEDIALALIRDHGMKRERAIPIAVSRVKLWAAGGGNVNADTRAKAAKAVAEWEAKKAKAKMDNVTKTIGRRAGRRGGDVYARAARGAAMRRARDGDNDGFVDDGKPTMRPAPPKVPQSGTVGRARSRGRGGDLVARAERGNLSNRLRTAEAARNESADRPWQGSYPELWKDQKYNRMLNRAKKDMEKHNGKTGPQKAKSAQDRQIKDYLKSAIYTAETPDDIAVVAAMLREVTRKTSGSGFTMSGYGGDSYWESLVRRARALGALDRTKAPKKP